jgi:hypothetical protein
MRKRLRKKIAGRLGRRTWCYLLPPKVYGMAACRCGNVDTQWSEYNKHLWCDRCKIDFIPRHAGIFDGPIPIKTSEMLGVTFHRRILATGVIERFDTESLNWVVVE